MMKGKTVLFSTEAALIAALYVVLVLVFQWSSFGGIQFRVAEALTVLPFFTPAAVPGLTIGCLLANVLGGSNIYDIVFGTLATALGAYGSYLLRRYKWLVPVPPIMFNTLIIPLVLKFAVLEEAQTSLAFLALSIFASQSMVCGVLGMWLLFALQDCKIPFYNKRFGG